MKHTPGPWRVVKDPSNLSLQVYGQTLALFECWRRSDEQTEIANARLVAAAPELLETLKEVFADHDAVNQLSWNDRAAAVIAKATRG